jgi:hypothetical protein
MDPGDAGAVALRQPGGEAGGAERGRLVGGSLSSHGMGLLPHHAERAGRYHRPNVKRPQDQ